tara:strand:- start:142 stop:1041 length:900 start_codon:yes stop_codon:yes gene_type:complete
MTHQRVIAVVFDCDKTLTPNYMQLPLFEAYGIDNQSFWRETDEFVHRTNELGTNLDPELGYLNMMLRHVKAGKLEGLSNAKLRELGGEIEFFEGLPGFFKNIKKHVAETTSGYDITLEQYVISTGLTQMLEGSKIADYMDGMWGCEFVEEDGVISQIARTVSYTEKTRFLHELRKGCNVDQDIHVNSDMPRELRRIPFHNMIYVGDGPSDIPCFATLNKNGGTSIAIYHPDNQAAFEQAYDLRQRDRVFAIGPGDFTNDSHTKKLLYQAVEKKADAIIKRILAERAVRDARIHEPPRHV